MVIMKNNKKFFLILIIGAFTLSGCSPFGNSSLIDNLNSIGDSIIGAIPFKDIPVRYGDATTVETVTTDGSTNSVVGYSMSETLLEVSDSQATSSTTSSANGYTFTEVYQ